jgi:hypothetical protein
LAINVGRNEVAGCLNKFMGWLEESGYASYDHYDFWATSYGIWSKNLYYHKGKIASPLVAPLVLADWLFPACRKIVWPKTRFPIADAHYLMGFVCLYRVDQDMRHLAAARDIAAALLASSIPGFSGPCWGYPFDWQTKRGLWKQGTPLVTTTPYVFDAFWELYRATRELKYLEIARSIAEFVFRDIRETPQGRGSSAGYTPFDRSRVINASAYRAACLGTAVARFGLEEFRLPAQKNAWFVIDRQRPDGSWPYSADDPRDAFTDHIHTCFVLKGLYRAYQVLGEEEILTAVRRGYQYYRAALFNGDDRPRTLSLQDGSRLRLVELYDFAEALNLALLLEPEIATEGLADKLVKQLLADWQTPAGFFITRISTGGLPNKIPYHRWGQSQVFRSLALYYRRLQAE